MSQTPSGRDDPEALEDDCVIPPPLPPGALPNLLYRRDREAEDSVRQYVEWQASDELVEHAERVATEYVLGRRLEAWDVYTDKNRWWVITSPLNLYSQSLFPSLDYTISFHVGVTTRMMSEPDTGVPALEQIQMAKAWRIWEQACESLELADEAQDFQAVGMRCRESLIAMVKIIGLPTMVPENVEVPKRSDVVAWCDIVASYVARGSSAQHVRGYLRDVSKAAWQLVNWLTHASNAAHADAVMAIDVTQHVLSVYGTAFFRHVRGIPDQCPSCGSYKVGLWRASAETESVPKCQSCGHMPVYSASTSPS